MSLFVLWSAAGKNLPVSESCRHDLTMTTNATSHGIDLDVSECNDACAIGLCIFSRGQE